MSFLRYLAASAGLLPVAAWAQITNPVPAKIAKGPITLEVSDWIAAPATGSSPRARLSVTKPAYDGSGRLFVCDLNGQMYVIRDGVLSTYLDLEAQIPAFVEEPKLGTGFHSFAFHPDFKTNGKFYTAHTENPGAVTADFRPPTSISIEMQSVITEWTVADPSAAVFTGTHREVLRIDFPHAVHNVQDIAFNPYVTSGNEDYGMLYVCVGDGEAVAGGYPEIGHRLDSVMGTLLRIDPLGTNGVNGRYGVPAGNPFVADGDAATLGEIYAWGFRNPHRLSWDSAHPDRLYLFNIGERQLEEVEWIVKGGDHGYSVREGTFELKPSVDPDVVFPLPANDASFDYVYPVAQYDHDEGRAIAGGFVYRGTAVPQLTGRLIFGDIANGRIFTVPADGLVRGQPATVTEVTLTRNGVVRTLLQLTGASRTDLRFGMDESGELYVTTKQDGKIRRVLAQPPPVNGTGRIANIATRGEVGQGAAILIGGFVVEDAKRALLIRGVGPTLGSFGVANALADPMITLYRNGSDAVVASNDNWGAAANAAEIASAAAGAGAFALTAGSADASLLLTLEPGAYTVHLAGAGGSTGVGLIEVYEIR